MPNKGICMWMYACRHTYKLKFLQGESEPKVTSHDFYQMFKAGLASYLSTDRQSHKRLVLSMNIDTES